ncbi:carbohydrate kinase [Ochrobactrum sp. 695/2009]|nr:FGGY-family carbohydrate kinase [Brucella intermedia]PJR91983.1 carbohydrate kinase [Ochrobactrum sp. 721/2009]PJT15043.1 carbohydrate kinase [Ochrobactrum sp. 720/2009]PJT20121.1 carbohydrate kinase [Ochrobactrum sp. 715/2009]PJT28091.1 carbohydrate kinase [Ochrobactrum sp. 695/2009]PJT34553.1 carbohydrate kinase [Ochrobactrum sp. 689/2009]
MAYFLTADGGTESVRARVYDLSGTCLASAAVPYETKFSSGARAEQNPEDWWSGFVTAARKAIADSSIDPSAIEAITLATTSCTVVALDASGKPLRPSIIWMDVRASAEADAVLATADIALQANGGGRGPVSAEWMIPKALWLARNEPEIFEKADTICEYQDFMTLRLTGEKAASLNNVSLRWHYSTDRGGFPVTLLEKLGLSDLLQKWPSGVVAPGEVIGGLCASAACELGLSQSVKVVQGGADALIGMIGLGVAKPGQLALITGSSHLQFGVAGKPLHAPGIWGSYPDMVYPGRYIIEGGQTSTGSIIAWLGRLMNGTMDMEALNAKAAALEPGAEGLLVQDHFQGNRTPYTDALSRGAIVGLTLAHEPHHIFRAIMEGISFGTRTILDAMAEAGYRGQEITVGGGASASPLWLQIHADTAGLPVCVPQSRDAPSVGAAVLAAHGAGHFATIDEGIAAMVKPGKRIEPRPREMALYNEIYQQYRALYPALKAVRAT